MRWKKSGLHEAQTWRPSYVTVSSAGKSRPHWLQATALEFGVAVAPAGLVEAAAVPAATLL
jgi:hypothetical protein